MPKLTIGATAPAVAFALGTMAFAPLQPASGAERASSSNDVIEEIIVTSRRRDESVQDVPLSVTAFGAEAIARLKPQTLRDFDGLAPNLYVGNNAAGPGASAIFIRGVGYADIEKTQSPQVGVIVDGVQIGSSTGQLIDVFDVESIEVNRGPQGVLFGKNTIGGNIVVNRLKPQFNEFGYKGSLAVGNYDSTDIKLRVNVPLIDDKLALKVGAIERRADGFFYNDTLRESAGDVDFNSQTFALRWAPVDSLDAILTYDRIHDLTQTKPQDPRADGDTPFVTLADKRQPTRYDVDQWSLRADWAIADSATLSSITGYHSSADIVNQDFDAAAARGPTSSVSVPFAQLHTLRDQDYDVFTQEFKLAGDINQNFNYVLGFYYFDSSLNFKQSTSNILQLPSVALGAPPGTPCSAIPGTRANEIVPSLCQLPNARSQQFASEKVESVALFGALYWRPNEKMEISLGARYIDEEKEASNVYFDFSDGTFDVGNANEFDFGGRPRTLGTNYEAADSWDDVIFTASANYAVSDSSNLYANYSEGFRSGGFSIRSARDPLEAAFDPEDAFQIEVGLKNEFLDNRVRANLAYFHLSRSEAQFSSIIPLPPGSIPGTTTLINNGGDSKINGLEAEVTWLIDENFTLQLQGGFIDVKNKRFDIACELVDGCVTPTPGVLDPLGTVRNLGGDSDTRQPEWNYSITAAYNREWGPGIFDANVIWKHNGEALLVNTGGGADQRLIQPDYGQLGATIRYEIIRESGDIMSFAAVGRNLTNKEWLENALFLGGPNTGFQSWGPPRTYQFEFTYSH